MTTTQFAESTEDTSLVDFLELDPRPTFVLDLMPDGQEKTRCPTLIWCNNAMDSAAALKDVISSSFGYGTFFARIENEFTKWAAELELPITSATSGGGPVVYLGHTWSAITLKDRWRVVSGSQNATSTYIRPTLLTTMSCDREVEASPISDSPSDSLARYTTRSLPAQPVDATTATDAPVPPPTATRAVDWTRSLTRNGVSPHLQVILNADWASTEVGPLEEWSPQLQLLTYLVMIDPNPAILLWGKDLILIYNEAFIPIFGLNKYPECVGKTFREHFPEVFAVPQMEKFYNNVFARGRLTREPTRLESQRHFLMSPFGLQEKYFCYSFLPVEDGTGNVVGFYEPCVDNTKDVLHKRRVETLRYIGRQTESQTKLSEFWPSLVSGFEENDSDFPFVLVYSLITPDPGSLEPPPDNGLAFEGSLGLEIMKETQKPQAHQLLQSSQDFLTAVQRAKETRRPVLFEINDEEIAQSLSSSTRGFGDVPKCFVICAVGSTTSIAGILVLGLNSRDPYETPYERFLELVIERASLSLTSIMLLTEHSRALHDAAASEDRFRKMIQSSPVGAYMMRDNGQMQYANQAWTDITGYKLDYHSPMSWMEVLNDDDQGIMAEQWGKLVKRRENVLFEIRLKKPWIFVDPVTGVQVKETTWVLSAASTSPSDTGEWYITGCITDISRQKYSETLERRKTKEAIEMKRQQENFIDMTSHEIRNPLSAIIQSTDSITSSLSVLQEKSRRYFPKMPTSSLDRPAQISPAILTELSTEVESALDSSRTISLCSQHLKRIVDDVLILSKLDSALLELTPVDVEPKIVAQNALEMFSAEFSASDVQMEFQVEQSYYDLGVGHAKLDSSRLVQILINLIGNALKFTKTENTRKISLTIGASVASPASENDVFTYFPSSGRFQDPTVRPDWGQGEPVYLIHRIRDTGRGISDEEMTQIFGRFAQGNPKTHITYGGSGLGLHIARELCEMQGGRIGVTSHFGQGSNFTFYIKARRCKPSDVVQTPFGTLRIGRKPSRQYSDPGRVHTVSHGKESSPSSERQKIYSVLIVEDNLVNQKVLSKQLKKLGWTVAIANHGVEALEYLKRTQYWAPGKSNGPSEIYLNLILMDIEMPVMDGLTCANEIRRLEKEGMIQGHVPIIAVSANARLEQINNAKNAGMDDVVSKPFRIPDLVAKVELMVGD